MNTTSLQTPRFTPPFCPNSNCKHHNGSVRHWPYKKHGFYDRQQPPYRIQRFTCRHCNRSFSSQTFSTTYWQKRPDLMGRLFTKAVGCMSNRQIARDLGVAPETVNRQLARLGRHCLLLHTRMMRQARPAQKIVIDGFVSFEWSQYFPFHHHLAVEKETDFFLYFTDSEVRRSGAMTAAQKRRRRQLEQRHGRPDPQAVRKDVRELLTVVTGGQPRVQIDSDEHRAYPAAIRATACEIAHRVTPSRERRDRENPLWAINLLDLLIRHCSANHKRETIAWSKRRLASALRLAVFLFWRNYLKGRREKQRQSPTPAMARRMCRRPLTVAAILRARLFRTRIGLPARWERYYQGTIRTRPLGRQREHRLKYAV